MYSVTGAGAEIDGRSVELAFHVLERRDDDHRITAMEIFPADALDEALSAFRGESGTRRRSTTCAFDVEANARAHARCEDWESRRRPTTPTTPCSTIGGRGCARSRPVARRCSPTYAPVRDSGAFETVNTPVAVRGERCALFRRQFVSSVYEVELLVLNELDERGLVQATVLFDLDDLDAAFAELDARYIAGEAAPYADVYRTCVRMTDLRNARDWDGMRSPFGPTTSSSSTTGREASAVSRTVMSTCDLVRSFADLAPDTIVQTSRRPSLSMRTGASRSSRHAGTSADGGAVEIVFLGLVIVRDGHIARIEQFPAHVLDEALRRFDELGPTPAPTLDNLCLRTVRRTNELSEREDWDGRWPAATPPTSCSMIGGRACAPVTTGRDDDAREHARRAGDRARSRSSTLRSRSAAIAARSSATEFLSSVVSRSTSWS